MLNKIFGKKDSNYFLELKEEDSPTKTETPQAEAEQAPVAPVAEASVVEEKAPEVAPEKKSKKTSVKGKKAKATPQAETKPASVPVVTAPKPQKAAPQEVTFASQYLITPGSSRRRPGPSLNEFKSMAREAKVPMSRG